MSADVSQQQRPGLVLVVGAAPPGDLQFDLLVEAQRFAVRTGSLIYGLQ